MTHSKSYGQWPRRLLEGGFFAAVIADARRSRRSAKPDRMIVQTGSGETIIRQQDIVRTHHSYLVNIDRIEEIRSTDSGGHEIRMQSGKRIPLSRGYREKFKSEITS